MLLENPRSPLSIHGLVMVSCCVLHQVGRDPIIVRKSMVLLGTKPALKIENLMNEKEIQLVYILRQTAVPLGSD